MTGAFPFGAAHLIALASYDDIRDYWKVVLHSIFACEIG